MTLKKSVSVFGVTGSIGASTVDILKSHADKYSLEAVTAHRNVKALAKVAIELDAKCAVIGDPDYYQELCDALSDTAIEVAAGENALVEAAQRPSDIVIAAIVGAAGLKPTLAAIRRGARVGLANKETLVCAGALMTAEITKHGATLIPVDSEHSAIFQVLEERAENRIDRILLTASGRPIPGMGAKGYENRHPCTGAGPPELGNGGQDFNRFRDDDEQRVGADRSLASVPGCRKTD